MCGISGIYNLNGYPVDAVILNRMNQAQAHRGPDDADLWLKGEIGLAHRRLSILDLSKNGRQPMHSADGRWVVVFNGCIYNYTELKADLERKWKSFRSTTDTEVIVEGLSVYGVEYVKQFNGMFAIAAWDRKEHCLYLTRDRYGVKPLYYWFNGRSLVFGSEIKAILEHPDYSISVDLGALNEYFSFQNLFSFRTLFKGINMLPPANTVCVNSQSTMIQHQSWWDYNFSDTDTQMSFDDAVMETKRLFKHAVERQMVADVPVGSYLSGGMDSGSITAVAAGLIPRMTTFTCGFDMSEVTGVEANFDERRDAELMANHFKTEHYEQIINAGDLSWSLPKVVYHLEDLRVGMSYPNYYISRLASKFVKVCLQGTGGDELFGGYPWRYYRVFRSLDQSSFFDQYYGFWQRLVPDDAKQGLFQSGIFQQVDVHEPRQIFERVFTFNDQLRYERPEDHINNSLYFEAKTFLPGLLLVGDKLSMANGLEERFPFLDNDLVDFASKIPARHKLGGLDNMLKIDENEFRDKRKVYQEFNDGKTVLRKAMEEFIPERIINRKKQGFSAPDESWYRGENAAYIRQLLLEDKTVSSEFIDQKFMKRIVHEHIDQRINHRLLIWSLMNFEWWCRVYLKK